MLCRGIAVRDGKAAAHRIAGSQTDIHERKLAEEQLLHDALHDALTGLPNRVLLMDRLERALERAKRLPGPTYAVLFIDLDRFKNVNDSLGHIAGDELLVECGQRLGTACRPGDTLARLGGDEFVLLLEDISGAADAVRVAQRIMTQFSDPFRLNRENVFMAASIGIALGNAEYERPQDVLRDADTALYRAKAQGKGCYSLFDATMHTHAVDFLRTEMSLRQAIELETLELHYQPVVSLESGIIAGFEALLRWKHETRGIIMPSEFISLAEETGLMPRLGQWALREACRQLRVWQKRLPGTAGLTMSVNVSGKEFSQNDLVEKVAAILEETRIDGRNLRIEVTESVLMENAELASAQLQRLRDLGIRISIDDFGTGYCSLSYLHRLPADTLKIDQSFVKNMTAGGESVEIIRTILSLAKSLHMDVVAEGAQTAEQIDILRSMGCQYGQGNFYSAPLPRRATARLLRENRRW